MTHVIGLTGNIGGGKTLACSYLRECGVPVIHTDTVSRQLMRKGEVSYNAIVAEFGEKMLGEDGELDRRKMSQLIFGDEAARLKVNSIVHPLVIAEVERLIDLYRADGKDMVVVESALIFEAGLAPQMDEVWLVTAPKEVLLRRVQERDGIGSAQAMARLDAQEDNSLHEALADVVIENNGDRDELKAKMLANYRRLCGEPHAL